MKQARTLWPGFAALALVSGILALGGCELINQPGPLADLETPEPLDTPTSTYLNLGRNYLRVGELRLAKEAFIRSLRTEGATAAALTGAGIAAERQGLVTEAKRFFEQARKIAPQSVIAHNNLGAALYKLGDYHGAKQAFLAAFALSSGENRVARHNLGLVELAIKRQDNLDLPISANPRPLQREGSGEYRLLSEDPESKEVVEEDG